MTPPPCPQCTLDDTHLQGATYLCNICGHEWTATIVEAEEPVRDANGNVLASGDSVVLVKDLKVKGSSITLKLGTKLKNIRVTPGGDHAVERGGYMLKQEFLRKA
jgi:protein PhnA